MQDYPTLGAAIWATQPAWLLSWLSVLLAVNFGAVLFLAKRTPRGWRPRWVALAIIVSFILASQLMQYLYQEIGYVRLLGLAHLVVWTPVYVWIFMHRKNYDDEPLFARYVVVYLFINGISLIIDTIDVIRFMLGDIASMI